jgi:hypothetical protein
MASFSDHVEHAQHNIAFLESFIFKTANDWALTVMFYTGVHICEALIYNEFRENLKQGITNDFPQDCNDHRTRDSAIHKLFYYKSSDGVKFCKSCSTLMKSAHDARYKIFKIRKLEVFNKYSVYFIPLIGFFNSYCELKGFPLKLKLQNYKFNIDELKND